MKIRKIGVAIFSAYVVSGCATVVNGTNIDYAVETDPDGAIITYLDGNSCETPCERSLPRSNHQRIDFAKDGYKPTYVLVQSKVGGATFGNVLAGGLIGAVVDSSNGSNRFLAPRPLIVRLAAEGSDDEAVILGKDGAVVSTVAEHNASVREKVAQQLGDRAGPVAGGAEEATIGASSQAGIAESQDAEPSVEADNDAPEASDAAEASDEASDAASGAASGDAAAEAVADVSAS